MTEKYNVKSLDDGYGDIKYDSKGNPDFIPSFVTSFKPKPIDAFQGAGNNLKYIASEIDGFKYTVGDYAMKLDPNIKWTGGEKKHSDARFPIMLKTTLGLMTSGSNEVIDTLMMNLPIKYDTPERREALTRIAQGTHKVAISTDGINFTKKIIVVENVEVKKQPFGSACDLILDANGEIINKEVAKGFNVIIDIGARTLNILTLDALEEQPALTIQTNDGMFSAYTQIGDYLETELGVLIPDGKLPLVVRDKEIKGRDITPLINQVYENHANTILNVIDKLLINSYAFVHNVVFTGGGAEVLLPYLNVEMGNIQTYYLNRFSTVRGLRKYGIRQAKKNIKRTNISVKLGNAEYHYKG